MFYSTFSVCQVVPYHEKYIEQYLDHFNFASFGNKTFKQRYLFQDKWWDKEHDGPIFFYTGNEGDINGFWEASGFVMDIAPQFGALVLFAEHRFYGKSLPAGGDSFKAPYIGLLTIEQALADFAVLLTRLKTQLNAKGSPVIAFGGSYGGMLTAFMRFKYPNIIDGGIAASAPLFMWVPDFDRSFFFKTVTQDVRDVSPVCESKIRAAFQKMNDLASEGTRGLEEISRLFNLCKPVTNLPSYKHLQGWIRNSFANMAMFNYPYAVPLFNLPANPLNVVCKLVLMAPSVIAGLASAAGLYYNGTHGTLPCFDIYKEYVQCADPTGCGLGPNAKAYDYQACTEVRLPDGTNNVTDMFPVLPWTQDMRREYCEKTWGISQRLDWTTIQFWGLKLKSASNLVFSNGDLDPWHGGGVNKSISNTVVAVLIKGGAHHLDLRHHNPADPPGVIQAREIEKTNIQKWILSAKTSRSQV
ncbi:dipeptidyl peptidase 2-like [Gigantopelta aegis]|uniref:dipeptidyl peptidase 2-like n=1 Tax=Gigantopelta aegis TaxID=1735272 RepID=UPI001B888DD5|nr:dipeptidyl peptidase 2-like [Gigantopelta aegis]